jgi:hypothetical protein
MISKLVLEYVYRGLSTEEAAMWSAFETPLMWRGFAAAVACDPRRRHSKGKVSWLPGNGTTNNMFFLDRTSQTTKKRYTLYPCTDSLLPILKITTVHTYLHYAS